MVGTLACPLAEAAACLRQTTTPRNGEALHEFETGEGTRAPHSAHVMSAGSGDRSEEEEGTRDEEQPPIIFAEGRQGEPWGQPPRERSEGRRVARVGVIDV
jgi:hypothetical protein